MNIRFFEAKVNKKNVWWFGGGFDLTPYFINKSDIHYWKNSAKELCDKYKGECMKNTIKIVITIFSYRIEKSQEE